MVEVRSGFPLKQARRLVLARLNIHLANAKFERLSAQVVLEGEFARTLAMMTLLLEKSYISSQPLSACDRNGHGSC